MTTPRLHHLMKIQEMAERLGDEDLKILYGILKTQEATQDSIPEVVKTFFYSEEQEHESV